MWEDVGEWRVSYNTFSYNAVEVVISPVLDFFFLSFSCLTTIQPPPFHFFTPLFLRCFFLLSHPLIFSSTLFSCSLSIIIISLSLALSRSYMQTRVSCLFSGNPPSKSSPPPFPSPPSFLVLSLRYSCGRWTGECWRGSERQKRECEPRWNERL